MKKLLVITLASVFLSAPCFATQFLIKVPVEQKLKTDRKAVLDTAYNLATVTKEKGAVDKIDIKKIKEAKTHVTDDQLWNTRTVKGFQLINLVEDISIEGLQKRINSLGLGWTILAATDGYKIDEEGLKTVNSLLDYNHKEVIKFIKRIRVYDSKGNFIREKVPTVVELGRFAGKELFQEKKEISLEETR